METIQMTEQMTDRERLSIIEKNLLRAKGIAHLSKIVIGKWMDGELDKSEMEELPYSLYESIKEIINIIESSEPDRSDFKEWGTDE